MSTLKVTFQYFLFKRHFQVLNFIQKNSRDFNIETHGILKLLVDFPREKYCEEALCVNWQSPNFQIIFCYDSCSLPIKDYIHRRALPLINAEYIVECWTDLIRWLLLVWEMLSPNFRSVGSSWSSRMFRIRRVSQYSSLLNRTLGRNSNLG